MLSFKLVISKLYLKRKSTFFKYHRIALVSYSFGTQKKVVPSSISLNNQLYDVGQSVFFLDPFPKYFPKFND